ncbi:Transposase [Pseudomonas syringae pv. actinidiae]|uniref:Transposase n=1 Tax=Pseudomonas syringae pv. actinidiae TaxID=103796 RepID=A0AAN4TM52_PSESF|nr:Transposase [Pseudomonas syringae pv. actinidiae]
MFRDFKPSHQLASLEISSIGTLKFRNDISSPIRPSGTPDVPEFSVNWCIGPLTDCHLVGLTLHLVISYSRS